MFRVNTSRIKKGRKVMGKRVRGPAWNTTKEDVIAALTKTGGMIAQTIKLLHMSPSDFYDKYRHDPEIEKLIHDLHLSGATKVTEILYAKALEGDLNAIKVYLKYNPELRELGWCEEQKVTIKTEKPLSEEEKKALQEDLFG